MFDFYSVGRLHFGSGEINHLAKLIDGMGKRFIIISDGRVTALNQYISIIEEQLGQINAVFTNFNEVYCEPDPQTIDKALAAALAFRADAVISIGGGSVIDTGKAIAGLATNGGSIVEYLEGVGTGKQVLHDTLPHIVLPTTSGTGAEVTKNAVITSIQDGYKKSFRSEKLMAKLVVIDSMLTVSLPPAQTAASGMDALTQCIEAYTTKKHNPIVDGMALEGIKLAACSLKSAVLDGASLAGREAMAAASVMSGLCLANAGLGAVHGIAASLGAHIGIGHGLACAILLPHVMALNIDCLTDADGEIDRYAEVGKALTGRDIGNAADNAAAGVNFVRGLNAAIGIPENFKAFHINSAMVPTLARDSAGSSMSGNPVLLDNLQIEALISKLI